MNKVCAAIVVTPVSGLALGAFAQKRSKHSVIFIGGGASTGAVVKRNRGRGSGHKLLGTMGGRTLNGAQTRKEIARRQPSSRPKLQA